MFPLKPKYKWRDEFTTTLPAGSVNGTRMEPGPWFRTVVDTENKLTIADGRLTFAGGKASPAYGDPGYWKTESITRKRGLIVAWKLNINDVTNSIEVGLDTDKTGEIAGQRFRISADTIKCYDGATAGPVIAIPTGATDIYLLINLRDAGAYFLVKFGTGYWKYGWRTVTNNTATLHPGVSNYNAVGYVEYIRQINYPWMPTPLVSTTFPGDGISADGWVSNGLGHLETTGLGSGGAGVVWSGSTATIASNRLVITPTLGPELNSGDIVIGNWYSITATQANFFYTGCAVGNTFRCTTAKTLSADNKVKLIDLASCYSFVTLGVKDVEIRAKFTMQTGVQAGIIIGMNSAGTSFINLRHKGDGNVTMEICEAGAYTTKATTAIAYSADTEIVIRRDDTVLACYYNNSLVGAACPTTTLNDWENENLSGLKVGAFSTSELNSFSSFVAHYSGSNGEINILDRLISISDAVTPGVIMPMGTPGAGVGICPSAYLPPGFVGMTGYTNPTNSNFGNYQTADGSVMVCIPKFYYKEGTGSNGLAVNVTDIKGIDTYPTTALANAVGYALHRAFIDGGAEVSCIFVDKYMCSKVLYGGNYIAASIKNGLPLSTAAVHNPIADLTACSGSNTYADTIRAAKARNAYTFCTSVFIDMALALISKAHGQACTSTNNCAWYGAKNYPKGCNNNALKDTDDTSVVYVSDGYSNCGKTGSSCYFSKTTHNGQACGVADLNGLMYETRIGLTCIATTASISAATKANPCQITTSAPHGKTGSGYVMITGAVGMTEINDKIFTYTYVDASNITLNCDSSAFGVWSSGGTLTFGTFYIAKEATAMRNFTYDNTIATGHWGATGVAAMMQAIDPVFKTTYPNNGFAQKWGSGTNQVLSEATSGDAWLRSCCGFPKDANGIDATGTDLFGKDYFYQYITNEMCVLSCYAWDNGPLAGVWGRRWGSARTNSTNYVGFRCSACSLG